MSKTFLAFLPCDKPKLLLLGNEIILRQLADTFTQLFFGHRFVDQAYLGRLAVIEWLAG